MIFLMAITLIFTVIMVLNLYFRQNVLIESSQKTLKVLQDILHTISPKEKTE